MSYTVIYQRTIRSDPRMIELATNDKLCFWFVNTGCKCCSVKIWQNEDQNEDQKKTQA